MKIAFTYICLLFSFSLLTYGQQDRKYKISGTVIDENNAVVPYANVALYDKTGENLIGGIVSDDTGKFEIATGNGTYQLKVSFLSYQDKTISNLEVNSGNVDLGRINLASSTQMLDEITVQGEKSQMQLQLDKRVFNVGTDLSNISSNAADILDNVPSVSVDVEGNVSLRGSENVRILIDGKPSGLTGISTADALRQLQGNLIESIEVITNPSARYDAEGEVGIINVILKKERQKGVNGSFTVNTGYPHNHGGSFSMNFRKEKMNFFSSYGINYRKNPGRGYSYQLFDQPDTTFSYEQINSRERGGISHNIRAGMDYFFNDRNILTGSFVIRNSDGLNTSRYEYLDYNASDELVGSTLRTEREEEPEFNSEIALNYRKEFERKDRLFTVDFKWIENIETENATFEQTDLFTSSLINERSRNTEDERNLLLQADYIHPFAKKGKWEFGLKSTMRVFDNAFKVEQLNDETGDWFISDENFNNNLIYTENIHAGYFIIGNESGKYSYQAGLRGELTDIEVELKKDNSVSHQNYFNLFPSAHFSYHINKDKAIQLSYSYRLSRPRFRELIPFSGYSDNRSPRLGNPNLRPEYTHSLEAGYLLNWSAGSILSSVYYRYRTGVVSRIPIVNENTGFVQDFPVNLATQNAYGLEFNFSYSPVDWWQWNTSANFYRAITDGQFEETSYDADAYTWQTRSTSKFSFLKVYDFQASFRYRAPRVEPTGRRKALYMMDLGMSRELLKGNGTLTASVRDLFNSRKWRGITETEGYYEESEFQWRSRQFTLTFNYRLNQNKQRRGNRGDGPNEYRQGGDDFDGGGDM